MTPDKTIDKKTLALGYLQAVATQRYDALTALLAPDLLFKGPVATRHSAEDYIGALKRLAAVHVRNDVRHVFVDGDEVCVIYDFVTDTAAGALPTIEWLHFQGDRIAAIDLFYDRLPWQEVMTEIAARSSQQPRPAAVATVA